MLDDEQHLAEMVSPMGPPPPAFLKRSEKCQKYWDENGKSHPTLVISKDIGADRRGFCRQLDCVHTYLRAII